MFARGCLGVSANIPGDINQISCVFVCVAPLQVRDDLQADLVDSKEKNVKDRATSGKSYRVVCQVWQEVLICMSVEFQSSQL